MMVSCLWQIQIANSNSPWVRLFLYLLVGCKCPSLEGTVGTRGGWSLLFYHPAEMRYIIRRPACGSWACSRYSWVLLNIMVAYMWKFCTQRVLCKSSCAGLKAAALVWQTCVCSHLLSSPRFLLPCSSSEKVSQYHTPLTTPNKWGEKEKVKSLPLLTPLKSACCKSGKRRTSVWRRNGMNLNLTFHMFGRFVVSLFFGAVVVVSTIIICYAAVTNNNSSTGFIWMKTFADECVCVVCVTVGVFPLLYKMENCSCSYLWTCYFNKEKYIVKMVPAATSSGVHHFV